MTEFSFAGVSVSSSGREYFQVLFQDDPDSDSNYFVIQRQFESYDGGLFYVETDQPTLCGHFRIKWAQLGKDRLRFELASQPIETVQISFEADTARYNQLRRVLKIMIPSRKLKIE